MPALNQQFDLIIDKATLDTILCGEHAYLNVARMMREVYRLLKTGAVYCLISQGEPS